jgi:membrane-bound lytic murein transglycosylase A
MLAMLAACSSKPTDRGQQYNEGKFTQPFSLVNQPDAVGSPINAGDFSEQVNQIRSASPRLYNSQSNVYNALQEWLRAGGDTRTLSQFGIDAWQMQGPITMATSSLPATTRRWCRRAILAGRIPVPDLPDAAEAR